MLGHFRIPGGVGFCNSVRRTLLSDLSAWAPKEVVVRCNKSFQTDEYLAHRIGLVPFKRVGNGDTMTLRATGPCVVDCTHFVGPAFQPVHDDIEIIHLDTGQTIDMTIVFDRQLSSKHARYCPCAAVGMTVPDTNGECAITFESCGAESPKELMLSALDAFERRVDRALLALANQPTTPPKSFC